MSMHTNSEIRITLNGQEKTVSQNNVLSDLLSQYNLSSDDTVIEANGVIIKKEEYARVGVHSGDVIELIRFVGGG